MFLIDTNCFIQLVRRRPEAPQVQAFLNGVPRSRLFVTLFTLHSIGVIMSRFGQIEDYIEFIGDLGIGRDLAVLKIEVTQLNRIADACAQVRLDFDDAYQYVAAEQNKLSIVSFDADFDHTPRGRLTPAAALQRFTDEQRQQTP
ncbi:MAG TPA: PIN domain-containing protein [Tepidisphaeraceae bacterium]|nr:PIN domain-containing protein [Tepidisphaeraceae bacterium]